MTGRLTIIVCLHKKGNPKGLENNRPIRILNCLHKVLTKVLGNRISRIPDKNQPIEHVG